MNHGVRLRHRRLEKSYPVSHVVRGREVLTRAASPSLAQPNFGTASELPTISASKRVSCKPDTEAGP